MTTTSATLQATSKEADTLDMRFQALAVLLRHNASTHTSTYDKRMVALAEAQLALFKAQA